MKKLLCLLPIALSLFLAVTAFAVPYIGSDFPIIGSDYNDVNEEYTNPGDHGWIQEGTSIYTNWENQWVQYETLNLDAGTWNIGLNVTNHGNLEGLNYNQFQLSVNINDGTSETIFDLDIDANDNGIEHAFITTDLTAGDYTVTYTWTNDAWGGTGTGIDANLQIMSAFFDNVATGDGGPAPAPVPEPATILLLGLGLVGLAGISRKRK